MKINFVAKNHNFGISPENSSIILCWHYCGHPVLQLSNQGKLDNQNGLLVIKCCFLDFDWINSNGSASVTFRTCLIISKVFHHFMNNWFGEGRSDYQAIWTCPELLHCSPGCPRPRQHKIIEGFFCEIPKSWLEFWVTELIFIFDTNELVLNYSIVAQGEHEKAKTNWVMIFWTPIIIDFACPECKSGVEQEYLNWQFQDWPNSLNSMY